MEIWDLYTKDRKISGLEHVRGVLIPDGYYHLAVHVWIRNTKGQYIISQRSEAKKKFPLMWECVGGSVLKGENSYEGALRETQEEIGVDLSKAKGKVVHTAVRDTNKDIADIWLFEYDGEITLEKATTKEVIQSKWMSESEVLSLFEQGKMVPTIKEFFDIIRKN